MTPTEVKEVLDKDCPLWVRLTGSNRVWRYGGWDSYRQGHTALHQQDGLVRYFQVEEVREVLVLERNHQGQGNASAGLSGVMDADEHSYSAGWGYARGIPKVRK